MAYAKVATSIWICQDCHVKTSRFVIIIYEFNINYDMNIIILYYD